MARISPPTDWNKVYGAFDGNMPECLGGACSTPCCASKEVLSWGKGPRTFNTTMPPDEFRAYGELPTGVTAETIDIGSDRMHISVLISGCLSENGECKLAAKKPTHCRVYPFRTSEYLPIDTRCPQAKLIASNPDTVTGFLQIREALIPNTDNSTWLLNLAKHLERSE